jgi:hypothetical protein
VWALLAPGAGPAAAKTAADRVGKLKQKVLNVPEGSVVQVHTRGKENLRGRVGPVSDEGFTLKTVMGDKVVDRQLRFDETKSINVTKTKYQPEGSQRGRTVGYVVLGGLAALGVILVVTLAVIASGGC